MLLSTTEAPITTIELPDDLEWVDEFSWTSVEQNTSYSATGSLFIQESTKQAGRPITLQGADDMGWITRDTAEALQALKDVAGTEITLELSDERTFTVMFMQNNPIEISPVRRGAFFGTGDYFKINSIKLMEV